MLEELKPADGFTFMSLLAGVLAVIAAIAGRVDQVALLIILSAVFDKLDGWLAKATGTSNQFGMFLDSLIDICSFGMVPVVVTFIMVDLSLWIIGGSVVYLFAGAYRLARYQLDNDTQSKRFKGMPITLNAIIFPVILYLGIFVGMNSLSWALPAFFIISAILMVSKWEVPHW